MAIGVGGGIVLSLACWQVSGMVETDRQANWVAVAVVGSSAACLAMSWWLLSGRLAIRSRLQRLDLPAREVRPKGQEAEAPKACILVASQIMAHYHRPSCALAVGKPVQPRSRAEHEAAGRVSCGVCEA